MAKDIAVFGLYPTRTELEHAVEALRSAGFRATDISVLLPGERSTHELGHEVNSKAPEGGVTGAAAGGAVGGVLAWLASVGLLTVPGIGPLLAAGPIVAALAGVGAGGAAGGLIGALVGAGMPEVEAKRYEGRIRKGHILCSVHSDDNKWADRAKEILRATGAQDISSTAEATADYRP
jgi:hypothetical protein